jgi:hypothetical protein
MVQLHILLCMLFIFGFWLFSAASWHAGVHSISCCGMFSSIMVSTASNICLFSHSLPSLMMLLTHLQVVFDHDGKLCPGQLLYWVYTIHILFNVLVFMTLVDHSPQHTLATFFNQWALNLCRDMTFALFSLLSLVTALDQDIDMSEALPCYLISCYHSRNFLFYVLSKMFDQIWNQYICFIPFPSLGWQGGWWGSPVFYFHLKFLVSASLDVRFLEVRLWDGPSLCKFKVMHFLKLLKETNKCPNFSFQEFHMVIILPRHPKNVTWQKVRV